MYRKAAGRVDEPASEAGRRSFLGPTVRRSLRAGRMVLVIGTAWSVILGVSIAIGSGPGFASSFPLVLPIFGSIAAIGALTVFTSDRTKGVLEYLMAYGISPRRLFTNFIVAALASISIVLALAVGASVGAYVVLGNRLSVSLLLLLGVYAIPMSYVSGAFATTVGMYWSALSSPREGMNSPLGIAPFLGILPPVAALVLIGIFGATTGITTNGFLLVTGAALALVALTVLYLLANIGHLLRRERLLSNA
jgi:hypothetical protein